MWDRLAILSQSLSTSVIAAVRMFNLVVSLVRVLSPRCPLEFNQVSLRKQISMIGAHCCTIAQATSLRHPLSLYVWSHACSLLLPRWRYYGLRAGQFAFFLYTCISIAKQSVFVSWDRPLGLIDRVFLIIFEAHIAVQGLDTVDCDLRILRRLLILRCEFVVVEFNRGSEMLDEAIASRSMMSWAKSLHRSHSSAEVSHLDIP